jgi:hypothetical protein
VGKAKGLILLHCKKRLAVFPSPAGISLTKLSLAGNKLIIPAREIVIPAGAVKTLTYRRNTTTSVVTVRKPMKKINLKEWI